MEVRISSNYFLQSLNSVSPEKQRLGAQKGDRKTVSTHERNDECFRRNVTHSGGGGKHSLTSGRMQNKNRNVGSKKSSYAAGKTTNE